MKVMQVMQEETYIKSSPEMKIMQEETYGKYESINQNETNYKSTPVENISKETKKTNESKVDSVPQRSEKTASESKVESIPSNDRKVNEAIYKQEDRPDINKFLMDDGNNKSISNRNLRTKNPINININYNNNRPSTVNDFDDKNYFRFDSWI